MRRFSIIVLSFLAAVALCFPPIIPVSALFGLSALTYEAPVDSGLTNDDVEEILALVSDHPEFGSRARYGRAVSLKEVILDYLEIGVLRVGRIDRDWTGSPRSSTLG
jgi:hypothetical protein